MKAGQFYALRGYVFRLKKKCAGCKGCFFENAIICPATKDIKTGKCEFDCTENGFLLIRA